jgi:D-proline reductase (dithiol) PrdB
VSANNDIAMRAMAGSMPMPEFDDTPWASAPPLAEATVAICTTAGLHVDGGEGWQPDADPSYRMLPAQERDLVLAHWSPNFDRVGIAADLNVAYPADRLDEMVAEGVIGAVGPNHVSFTGNQDDTVAKIRLETGPAAAAELKAQGIDVVLLTPV